MGGTFDMAGREISAAQYIPSGVGTVSLGSGRHARCWVLRDRTPGDAGGLSGLPGSMVTVPSDPLLVSRVVGLLVGVPTVC